MASVSEHSETFHLEKLNCLCRICGERSARQRDSKPPKLCMNYVSDLHHFHGVNVREDTNGIVYSKTMCNKCYQRLQTLKRRPCSSGKAMQTARFALEKSEKLWRPYDSTVSVVDCKVCSRFCQQSKGGRPLKADHSSRCDDSTTSAEIDHFSPQCSSTPSKPATITSQHSPQSLTLSSSITVSPEKMSTPPHVASALCMSHENTLTRAPSTITTNDTQTEEFRTPVKKTNTGISHPVTLVDAATCTSPFAEKFMSKMIDQIQHPFTRAEEKLYTHMSKIKLKSSEDKQTVVCHTGGQSLFLKKIVKPRKTSGQVKSPLAKKRAKILRKIREEMAGKTKDDAIQQHGVELKLATKEARRRIFEKAGYGQARLTSKEASRLKAKLELSKTKHREHRKLLRRSGVELSSEREERRFEDNLMCGNIKVDESAVFFYDKTTDNRVKRTIPVAVIEDIPLFASNLLDQYDQKGLLTWHDDTIPDDEVWIKVGGDHGGDSFKAVLQVVNVENPNSKDNTFLICLAECKDSVENLRSILHPYKDQLAALSNMTWHEKKIKLFLFGDYDFLLKLYGLSGAQGVHPCLWCKVSKHQTKTAPNERPSAMSRTLDNIKGDYRRFKRAGCQKKKAKAYSNVVTAPIWDIELTQVSPPYLHLLLGIVKKHHDLLETECHRLDEKIAAALAKETNIDLSDFTPPCRTYIKSCTIIEEKKREQTELEKQGSKVLFQELYDPSNDEIQDPQDFYDAIDILDEEIQTLEANRQTLPFRSGPVTVNLDNVLKKNRIVVQAFHSRSFIGNHCHKYLDEDVYTAICNSVVEKTYKITDCIELHETAQDIKNTFLTLNCLYSKVHGLLSHKRPIGKEEISHIQNSITQYMHFYRSTFPHINILPKQHILETHCVDWIARWGFGLALHGEQGGEQVHATVNRLKRRVWGIRNDSARLTVLMKQQLTLVSPMLQTTPKKSKKKTKP